MFWAISFTRVTRRLPLWSRGLGDVYKRQGDTTIAIDGVEYLPNVMTPQECAFVYNGTLSTFTLTTPLGSVTYPSQA